MCEYIELIKNQLDNLNSDNIHLYFGKKRRRNNETKYSFYDVGTLKALKEDFGYSEKQILDMDSNGLKKLGFSPDDISYIRNEELGLDTYTFAHKILTSASFDNLKEDLENLNGNNEYTKYYKKLIYDEKSYK